MNRREFIAGVRDDERQLGATIGPDGLGRLPAQAVANLLDAK